uniref:hypothetical protein n=1 Tax=Polynucleobacter sp. TaxID=2029855 RepID=UPI004048446E
MNQINHEVLKDILDLMSKSHTGKQGGGYGCLPRAAQIAVDTFGRDWISPQQSNLMDETLHDFFKCSIKLTSPPNSNEYRTIQKFFEYANRHVATLKINSTNIVRAKISPKELLKQLE